MSHGKAEEAKLQSMCVIWLWNNFPETRGLFFAVENEGVRLSSKLVLEKTMLIQNSLQKPSVILQVCRSLVEMCTKGNAVGGAQAKAMGVTTGVSDCIFLWKGKTYFFEFKALNGRQSEKQVWWQSVVEKNGFNYFIVKNFNDFVAFIEPIFKT